MVLRYDDDEFLPYTPESHYNAVLGSLIHLIMRPRYDEVIFYRGIKHWISILASLYQNLCYNKCVLTRLQCSYYSYLLITKAYSTHSHTSVI